MDPGLDLGLQAHRRHRHPALPPTGAGGYQRGHYATRRQACIGSIAGAGRGGKTSRPQQGKRKGGLIW